MVKEVFKIGNLKLKSSAKVFGHTSERFEVDVFDKEYSSYQEALTFIHSFPKGTYQIFKNFVVDDNA